MPGGGSLHPSTHETVEKKMHYVHQEGQQVFKYAVRRMADVACQLIERNGFSSDDLAVVVPHQANLRIIRAMQERLGVTDSKVMINIDHFGNTTAGTIPLGLRDAVEQGRLKKTTWRFSSPLAPATHAGILLRWVIEAAYTRQHGHFLDQPEGSGKETSGANFGNGLRASGFLVQTADMGSAAARQFRSNCD